MDLGLLALLLLAADRDYKGPDGSSCCIIGCSVVIGIVVLIVILWRMGAL